VPSIPLAASFDGITAAHHFKSAGKSQAKIKRDTHDYIGPLSDEVRAGYDDGSLRTEGARRAERAHQNGLAEAEAVGGTCTTTLLCNNDTAGAGSTEVTAAGLVGCACPHVVPGEGLAVLMRGAEQHMYYDYAIGALLKARSDTRYVYLDLACRYKHRFIMLVKDLYERGLIGSTTVMLLLPWMHAYDHDLICQLKHSAMYTVRSLSRPAAVRRLALPSYASYASFRHVMCCRTRPGGASGNRRSSCGRSSSPSPSSPAT
jgi:hypothetical protein